MFSETFRENRFAGTPHRGLLGGNQMTIMKGRALSRDRPPPCLRSSAPLVVAEELFYVSGAVGNAVENFKALVKPWEEATGHTVTIVPMPASTTDQFGQYRLWLAAGNTDIDLYQTDVIWAPQLADHFVDLTEAAKDLAPTHFPSIIESQTVNGKLVALPIFTDAPALYYRKDLLEKHGKRPSHDLGRAGRDRAVHPGRRARRRQGRHLGLRLAGQRL
jgi:trehalose/maltose transport system substrate-binding protein